MNDLTILWKLIEKGRKGENIGVSTGLPKLDKLIGGIQPSRYYLISAASSAGKTALALFMLYNMLKNMKDPVYVIYFSLEIGSEVLLAKFMSLYCAEEFGVYLTINDILSFDHVLEDENYNCLLKAKEWLASIKDNLIIIDKRLSARVLYKETIPIMMKLGKIENFEGREIYIPNNPKQLVVGVVDHVALVTTEEGRKLKEEIDLMSSYMVTLKRKFLLAWLPLIQQNRESSSMDRRKADMSEPGLNDVRDSSGPVQDSDVTLQIYYPAREKITTYRDYKILGENGLKDRFRSIVCSKNRYGIANQVIGCAFYGEVGWWKELPPGKDIVDFHELTYIHQNINKQEIKKQGRDIEKNSEINSQSQTKPIIFNF